MIRGIEDTRMAGAYEVALKHRPAPFVAQVRSLADATEIRIGVDLATLAHRVVRRLPTEGAGRSQPIRLKWRLVNDAAAEVTGARPRSRRFVIPNNRGDAEAELPPHWSTKAPLRSEQRKSLTWMLRQEQIDDKRPHSFVESEVAEAVLGPLGWRVEVKAERPVVKPGGVLADEVRSGERVRRR